MRRIVIAVVLLGVVGGGARAAAQEPQKAICFGLPATIVGTRGNDRIVGTPGPDVIAGRSGHDVIRGLGDDDLICGGLFADLLFGGAGNDRLSGYEGTDTLVGGVGNDELRLGETSFGGAGNDVLGDDRVDITAYPGPGDDVVRNFNIGTLSYAFATGPVNVSLTTGVATGEGLDRFEEVTSVSGSEYDDMLEGDATNNFLYGRGGNDVIRGLDLVDWIDGGPGDDELHGGDEGGRGDLDTVAFDHSPVGVDASLTRGNSTGPGEDTLVGFENIWGSVFADVLEGDDADNHLVGSWGRDEVLAHYGDDSITFAEFGDAGAGGDSCQVGDDIDNCEQRFPVDRSWTARIVSPRAFEVLPAESFDRVEVKRIRGLYRAIRRIRVGMFSVSPKGCRWWNKSKDRLVARACGRPRWNDEVDPEGTLPAGEYVALVRVFPEDGGWHDRRTDFRLE